MPNSPATSMSFVKLQRSTALTFLNRRIVIVLKFTFLLVGGKPIKSPVLTPYALRFVHIKGLKRQLQAFSYL